MQPTRKVSARRAKKVYGAHRRVGSIRTGERISENFTLARRNTRSHTFKSMGRRNTFWSFPTRWCWHPPRFSKSVFSFLMVRLTVVPFAVLQDSRAGKWRDYPHPSSTVSGLHAPFLSSSPSVKTISTTSKNSTPDLEKTLLSQANLTVPALPNAWVGGGDP